jgi:hypothetical protein
MRLDIADVFYVYLKGYSRALNFKKPAMWSALPKTQGRVIGIIVQPMFKSFFIVHTAKKVNFLDNYFCPS